MKQRTKGIICIVLAALGFSLMTVFIRLAGDVPTIQKAFFRNFVALILVSAIMFKNHSFKMPKKESIFPLFGRAFFGTLGLLCNFYAVDHLVLADANMLNKLSPFFAIFFSIILLKEKPNHVQIFGVAIAFIGSLLIIKPGLEGVSAIPAIIGMFGGCFAGVAYTFVRKLGKNNENSSVIIFVFSAFSCIVCLVPTFLNYEPMSTSQLLYLLAAGFFACLGQLGITKAYIYAPAREISVYDYSQVVFAALLGFAFFGQMPDWYSVAGYIIICAAGIGMFFYNNRRIDKTN